jgi:hypothetical protein
VPKTNFFQDQVESDRELLETIIESGKLTTMELEAFDSMREKLKEKRGELTENQRGWASRVKLEIDTNHAHFNLLTSVLGVGDRLDEKEREAFTDMLHKIVSNRRYLSRSQLEWVRGSAARHDVEEETLNLYSAGKVPQGFERKEKLLPWEQPGYVKVLRPPGR